jgi:hypothetical protein
VPPGNDSGRDCGDDIRGIGGVRTCLAILQTSVGEELGEAFDQVFRFSPLWSLESNRLLVSEKVL